MMKTLFYYCYYRIASFYRSCYDGYYLNWGFWILLDTFMCVAWAIAAPVFYILEIEYTNYHAIWVAMPFILLSFRTTFVISDESKMKKFKELEERYKNERHKKLKGWLIFLYSIGTLVLAVTMRIIFSH